MIDSQIKYSSFIDPCSYWIGLTIEFYRVITCPSGLDPWLHYLSAEFPFLSVPIEFWETPILRGLKHSLSEHYDEVSEIHREPLLRYASR